jgi:hypothetical protein
MSLEALEITFLVEVVVFALWRFRQEVGRRTPCRNEESQDWLRNRFSKRVPVLL